MKKELLIASLFAATVAGAGTITNNNVMGYCPVSDTKAKATTQVDSKNMILVTVPFRAYGSGASEIPVNDIIQTSTLNVGDQLYIPDGAGGYNAYTLAEGKTSWTANKRVTLSATGAVTYGSAESAATATLARGQAFWVKTNGSVNLMGEGTEDSASVEATGGGSNYKYNLVGSTSSTAAIDLTKLGGAKGDTILLADGTQYRCGHTNIMDGATKTGLVATNWYKKVGGKMSVTSDTIPAGVGFWYKTKTTRQIAPPSAK